MRINHTYLKNDAHDNSVWNAGVLRVQHFTKILNEIKIINDKIEE